MRFVLTAFCAVFLAASPALAERPTVKNRQVRQQKRIGQGVASGELTKAETRRLERNAARIRRSVVRDRVDGGAFTPAERLDAQRKLNKQSKAVYRQKHDAQDR